MGNYLTDFWQGIICESHVGNTGFNGFDLNKEFPKGGNPERGIPRWPTGIPSGNPQQRWQHLLPPDRGLYIYIYIYIYI